MGTKRLLLAEGDRDLRELFASALEEAGAAVVAVADGRLARDLLRAGRFDAAVLDARMPVMTGLEVLREFGRTRGATPILLLSSFADPELYDRAFELGAVRVLAKPLLGAELRRAIADVLDAL